ncbi:MAG TPA: hypothetical protein VK706_07055 [Candidatus Sulfotelmatobacter sp.]|jgi:hypothetical protein|nr:hypothetical protein [Candidatus Sulfotelmatobacter sp.]
MEVLIIRQRRGGSFRDKSDAAERLAKSPKVMHLDEWEDDPDGLLVW